MFRSAILQLTEADFTPHVFASGLILRVTLLFTLAWIAHFAVMRCSPYLRVYLWRAVVVGVATIGVMHVLPYRVAIPLRTAAFDSPPAPVLANNDDSQARALPYSPPGDMATLPIELESNLPSIDELKETRVGDSALAAEAGLLQPAPTSPTFATSLGWQYWLGCLWIAGAATYGCSWLVGVRRLRGIYQRATNVPAEIEAEVGQMATRFAYGRTPSVRHSGEISTAISFGFWQPCILIPTDQLQGADRIERQATLAHEVAHGAGGDLRWNHLLFLLQAACWFHPMTWSMRLAHADACDEVCDARAAAYLGDSKVYGRVLARLAVKVAGLQSAAGLAFARRSQVRKRVEIVEQNLLRTLPNRWRLSATFGSVGAAAVVMALLTITRAPAQEPSPAAEPPSRTMQRTTEPGSEQDVVQGSPTPAPREGEDKERRSEGTPTTASQEEEASTDGSTTSDSSPVRPDTEVGRLLTELEQLNSGDDRFTDKWANQLRLIAALGEEAVPELVEELDRTESDMMLRSIAFLLRAIDDERAIPALIRAIPKTVLPTGSDMGLTIKGNDEELLAFVQEHDLDKSNSGSEYSFGRPVREIFGALHSLTDQNFGEEELYFVEVNSDDLPSQKHAKRLLNYNVARRWAEWWNVHGPDLTDDAALQTVALPKLPEQADEEVLLEPDTRLNTGGSSSGWILQSAQQVPSKWGRAFYDFDTGRTSPLPPRWRNQELTPDVLEQIDAWAGEEGFDMMGDEIPADGEEPIFVLRGIGMRVWELPASYWKTSLSSTSMAELEAEGRAVEGDLLLHFDAESGEVDPLQVATMFYVTREGTPGLLYVGIQVQDDTLKPGGRSEGDDELKPIAFNKGRRFGFRKLVLKKQ